jgi:exosortase
VGLVIGVLYLPVFVWLVRNWLYNPYYGHGFLVPCVSALVFWLKRDRLREGRSSMCAVVIIAAGLLVYLLSYSVWGIYCLAALTLPVVLFGTIVFFSGMTQAAGFLFPLGFLVFMIPLPLTGLTVALQNLTVRSSAAVAGWFGVAVQTSGNLVTVPGASFTVGAQCSGMNSLISLLTVAAVLAFFLLKCSRRWQPPVLFLAAVPFALVGNTVRTALILIIAVRWGSEAALDYFHTWSSPLLFVLAVGLLFLLGGWQLERLRRRLSTRLAGGAR